MIGKVEMFYGFHLNSFSLLPELFLGGTLFQLAFFVLCTSYQRKYGFVISTKAIFNVVSLILLFTLFLIFNTDLCFFVTFAGPSFLINDFLAYFVKIVICVFSLIFLILGSYSANTSTFSNYFEYLSLTVVAMLGLFLLCSANDLLTAYLAIELQSISFYLMSGFFKKSSYSIESGLKYFITGALSSAFFLFGSSILYGVFGSISLPDYQMFLGIVDDQKAIEEFYLFTELMYYTTEDIYWRSCADYPYNEFADQSSFFCFGLSLIFISLFIKLSVAPFHFWSIDVYEGSPNITTMFFTLLPKISLFVFLTRVCYSSFYTVFVDYFQFIFFFFAVFSVLIGALGGLEQRKMKSLIAYSSVGHTGYLLLSFSTGSLEGVYILFYYLVIYMVSIACFWSVYFLLELRKSNYKLKQNKELGDFALLYRSNPALAAVLSISFFSMAGIPPLVGFLTKLGVFLTVIQASYYVLAFFAILFSVISTFYYIRFIKILYFENVKVGKLYKPIKSQVSFLGSFLSISLILLCCNPSLIYLCFMKASLMF